MPEIGLGTRAFIFPQPAYVRGYERAERVWLSPLAGTVRAGPADDLIMVVRPLYPKEPYAFPFLPPFRGHTLPPVEPGLDGHFDHIGPGDPEFAAVHAYACARRVIDIWQSYFQARVPWHFKAQLPRLEIIPEVALDNAQSGFGFLELGGETDEAGRVNAYALNFDVIAHEVSHLILFGNMGLPEDWRVVPAFGAFHEAFADLGALLGVMHFDTVLDRVLQRTRAELWLRNELNRIGELLDERQIRVAAHSYRAGDGSSTVHDRSRPITGAVFDWLMDLYVDILDDQGLIDGRFLRAAGAGRSLDDDLADDIGRMFARSFQVAPFAFRAALQTSRDTVGRTLAATVRRLDPEMLTLDELAETLLTSAEAYGARSLDHLEECLDWRRLLNPGRSRRTGGSPPFAAGRQCYSHPNGGLPA